MHRPGGATVLVRDAPLAEPPALEIYRGTPAASGPTGTKAAMRLVDTVPSDMVPTYEENGHVEFRDRLDPNEVARAPGQQVSYMVRTRVSRQRASADSALASLRVYPAPEPVGLYANCFPGHSCAQSKLNNAIAFC